MTTSLKLVQLIGQKPVKPETNRTSHLRDYEKRLQKFEEHTQVILTLMAIFNRKWQLTQGIQKATGEERAVGINITAIRKMFQRQYWDVIPQVASIWFNRRTRGNSQSKKCSTWVAKPAPSLNNQFVKFMSNYTKDNLESITEILKVENGKNEVEVTFKTTLKFNTACEQELFYMALQAQMEEDANDEANLEEAFTNITNLIRPVGVQND